jgi:hypothetical protein
MQEIFSSSYVCENGAVTINSVAFHLSVRRQAPPWVGKRKSTLISCDFVMFYDVFSQKGQRRLIRNTLANHQLAFASAHSSILRFTAVSRALLFAISSRVGLPPLFALRFLHSWFPTPNPIVPPSTFRVRRCPSPVLD